MNNIINAFIKKLHGIMSECEIQKFYIIFHSVQFIRMTFLAFKWKNNYLEDKLNMNWVWSN